MENGNITEITERERPQPRIDSGTMVSMVSVAFFFDVVQMIFTLTVIGSIVSSVMSIFIWLTFYVWFKKHGIMFMDNLARMIIMWGGFLLELVPVLNIIPGWTFSVSLSLLLIHYEDQRRLSVFNRQVGAYMKKFS
ncbi:hypothetical protein HYW58_01105 [Candidatus Kaiserbacteria bacterium]|nr:hypothetical protein [Candidatus Kaiserbacteria bacterium]